MNERPAFRALVSSLAAEGKSIVAWVQRNPIAVRTLERTLPSHCESGWAPAARGASSVRCGLKCFTVKNNKYLRVLVYEVSYPDALVLAIDYGFEFWTKCTNLMIPQPNDSYIIGEALADKLYVSGVTLSRPPSSPELATLAENVCQMEWDIAIEKSTYEQMFATFRNGAIDLKEIISDMGLIEIPVPWMNQPYVRTQAPKMHFPSPLHSPITEPVREDSNQRFKNPSSFTKGVAAGVTVTDVSEGPWGFTIQKDEEQGLLKDVEEILQKADKVTLDKPFFLGQTCLAYCTPQLIYARGLIVGMTGPKVNVNFVDYGCNLVLGSKDLFKLPAFGLRTPILGHRFMLKGINDVKVNDDDRKLMIKLFEDIVSNVKLLILVVPTEDGCVQTCELYQEDSTVNVKKIINTQMKLSKLKYIPSDWPTAGSKIPAGICHVESPNLFFVQFSDGVEALQEIIQDVANSAATIQKGNAKVDMCCLALFSDDEWYRAVVRQIVGTNLEVYFVDYGNTHVVTLSGVKEIPEKLVSGYKIQAVPCSLDCQEQYNSQELKPKLEAAVCENTLQIHVTAVRDDKLVVKILKNGIDYFKPKAELNYTTQNGRAETNDHQNDNYGLQKNGGDFAENRGPRRFNDNRENQRSNWRSENTESAGGFNEGGGRKRFDDSRDGQRSNWRSENAESAGGFNDGGGRKRFDDNRDDQRSSRRPDNRDSDTGFRNRDQGDGGNKFGDSDRPRRQPIRYDERIAAGDVFPEQTFEPDQTEDVVVTAFVSPHEFFVQTQANHAEFVELMTNMQTDYDFKFGFKKTEPPQENDPVIAEFSEDRVHYRAHVIEAEPMTVSFVDYGNFEVVRDARNVYPVMKKYAQMPIQAVKCMLKGVKCIGNDWSAEIAELFDKENLRCCFHENNDGVYVVSLSYDGNDLATDLIARKLVAADSITDQLDALPEDTTPFEAIDKTLLPGQILVGTIPFICDVNSFFIHLQIDSVSKIESLIADYVAKGGLKQVSTEDLQPDAVCLIPLEGDDAKYRGRIVEIRENDQISVQYIDYGDTCLLASSEILSLSEELKTIPALATECCMSGDTTQATNEIQELFRNSCLEIFAIIAVKGVQDAKLSVVLYDVNGKKLSLQDGINDAPLQTSLPTLPLLTREITAEITDFVARSSVLIKLPHVSPPEIEQFYTEADANDEIEFEALCAVKTSDGFWYRAKRINETQAYLFDNGRTEEFSLIQKLLPECLLQPVPICEVNCPWLFYGQCRVSVEQTENGFIIEPIEKLATISHVESASDIFVTPPSVTAELIDIALVDTLPGERPGDGIFAARFPDDEQWYRAEVVDESTMTVKFIDYGNTSPVTEVAPLPEKMKLISPQAVAIHFEGTLLETALSTLTDLQTNGTLLTLIRTELGNFELHLNGFNLLTKLTGLLPLAVDDTVYVCHAEGPELIFLQRDKDAAILAEIAEKLNNAQLAPMAADPDPNQLVAAKYEVDGQWYRSRVEGDQVIFVDHGNKENISELRELPEELKNIPPLAQSAALSLTDGYKWTDDADVCELFDVGFQIQEVSLVNNSYVVRLFQDDSDFGQKIVVQAGNISEATTEPVTVDDTPHDSDMGRCLLDELVEDVVSSFVAAEAVDPDASCSYDSGTFSKDLNSPQGRDENGNQPLDEVCSTVAEEEIFEVTDAGVEAVIVEDLVNASVEAVCSGADSSDLEEIAGVSEVVHEDVADTSVEIIHCDLDNRDHEVIHLEPTTVHQFLTSKSLFTEGKVAEADLNVKDNGEAVSSESIDGEEGTESCHSVKLHLEETEVSRQGIDDLSVEDDCEAVSPTIIQNKTIDGEEETNSFDSEKLQPVAKECSACKKVEVKEKVSDGSTLEQVTGNLKVEIADASKEVSTLQVKVKNLEQEPCGAEKPTEVIVHRKTSSDEKIVPGSINRGIIFSNK